MNFENLKPQRMWNPNLPYPMIRSFELDPELQEVIRDLNVKQERLIDKLRKKIKKEK